MKELISLGKIKAPWGLKGEVKFSLYHSNSSVIFRTRQVYLKAGFSFQPVQVRSVQKQGRFLLVHLEGFDSPEAARSLKGKEIFLPVLELDSKKEGEYYVFELIGLKVYTPRGKFLGIIKEITHFGASDILVIQGQKKKDHEYLIPLIPGLLETVSLKEQRVVVNPLEGLL